MKIYVFDIFEIWVDSWRVMNLISDVQLCCLVLLLCLGCLLLRILRESASIHRRIHVFVFIILPFWSFLDFYHRVSKGLFDWLLTLVFSVFDVSVIIVICLVFDWFVLQNLFDSFLEYLISSFHWFTREAREEKKRAWY